jgi:hypothetical protein
VFNACKPLCNCDWKPRIFKTLITLARKENALTRR